MSDHPLTLSIAVDQIPPRGLELDLTATTEERAALTERFDLLELERLEATLLFERAEAGVLATGRVRALATQACVVSGEPVPAQIDEPLHLKLRSAAAPIVEEEVELSEDELDELPIDGDTIDVGELVAQSFGLALDPYPRAGEAALAAARRRIVDEDEYARARNPFAKLIDLAAYRTDGDGN